MDLIQALILSVVEGITEFLPISSTGHLVLVSDLLNIPQTEFVKSFEVIIQLGAIMAIVVLYWKTLIKDFEVWKRILVAFLPTAVLGLVFYDVIKTYLLGNTFVTLIALLLGGIVLIVLELLHKEKPHHRESINQVSLKNAFLIGLFQSFSMIPGVSRAAATIFGGLFLSLKRKTAVEFSFLLAIPTMFAATGLDLIESDWSFTQQELFILAVGLLGAFVTALVAVRYFLRYVQNHSFIPFGIYRIVLAILFWILVAS